MSSIRLSGSTSGYYDLTVPAAAGTNSIDLSNLPVKDSNGNLSLSGNLDIGGTAGRKLTVDGGTDYNVVLRSTAQRSGIVIYSPDTGAFDTSVGSALVTTDGLFRLGTSSYYNVIMGQDGSVTTPNQPRFLAVPAGNANVSYSSQKHIYTAVAYNVGSHYDTSNGRFTAPIGGFYWFEHRMAMSGGNSSTLEAKIYKNGSEFARSYLDYDGSTATDRVQTIIQLSAGDYVEAWTHWASTNLNNYLSQGGGNTQNAITCFMGALVG